MEEKSNKKLLWIVLVSLLAVVLCYFFVVIYFFYIDTYNIGAKLSIWPFMSQEAKIEQFANATVEISFQVENRDYEVVKKNVVGVNVHKNGYIVALYDDFRDCSEDTQINIKVNSGQTMLGKIIFGDMNFNLAVLKCENLDGGEVKLPYLRVASDSELYKGNDVYAISPIMSESDEQLSSFDWHKMKLTDETNVYSEIVYNNYNVADYYMHDCWNVDLTEGEDFSHAAVMTKGGLFLGLSYEVNFTQNGEVQNGYSMKSTHNANSFLKKVIAADLKGEIFESDLAKAIHGFDFDEYSLFNVMSSETNGYEDGFYFEGKIENYTPECLNFPLQFQNEGYFVFKDFIYNDAKIKSGCVITSLQINNGQKFKVLSSSDFFDKIYRLDKGDNLTISYFDLSKESDGVEQSISFAV